MDLPNRPVPSRFRKEDKDKEPGADPLMTHIIFIALIAMALNGAGCATKERAALNAFQAEIGARASRGRPAAGQDLLHRVDMRNETRSEQRGNEGRRTRLDELKLERDLLQEKVIDLQRQLEAMQQDVAAGKKALADLSARLAGLEKEKAQLNAALTEARDQVRDLTTKLAAEQVKAATLREDKQRLMSGTTTAKEEIARLQKRASELETEAARAEDLSKRLAERDQEIERLRKAAADREQLAGKLSATTDELKRAKQRITTLADELANRSEEVVRMRQERDHLASEVRRHQESTRTNDPPAVTSGSHGAASSNPGRARPLNKPRQEEAALEAALPQLEERRAAAGKAPLALSEQKQPMEASSQLWGTVQTVLARSLESDIAKGDIALRSHRDQLTIKLADRVLYESGQYQIKPDGLKVLKKVSDALKPLPDKQVRVEEHTGTVSAWTHHHEQIASKWELFGGRAANVARYLLNESGMDAANLSVGISSGGSSEAGHDGEESRWIGSHLEITLSLAHEAREKP